MNNELNNKKAFTLIELVVAVGILAIVVSFAGTVFKVGINTQRAAAANAEIMRNLRAITAQLKADFAGLRKDGEIFVVWSAMPTSMLVDSKAYADDHDGHVRFDRIMFFANGDFHSYSSYNGKIVRGNVARVSYMLAGSGGLKAQQIPRRKRILARTQHILTADTDLADVNPVADWDSWHNRYEYDKYSLQQWTNIPWDQGQPNKSQMLTVITDVKADTGVADQLHIGAIVDTNDSTSIHKLLCQGVGEFMVQGWSDQLQRWVPEVDPDGDGSLIDTDFYLDAGGQIDPTYVPGVLYNPFYGGIIIKIADNDPNLLNQEHFNEIRRSIVWWQGYHRD